MLNKIISIPPKTLPSIDRSLDYLLCPLEGITASAIESIMESPLTISNPGGEIGQDYNINLIIDFVWSLNKLSSAQKNCLALIILSYFQNNNCEYDSQAANILGLYSGRRSGRLEIEITRGSGIKLWDITWMELIRSFHIDDVMGEANSPEGVCNNQKPMAKDLLFTIYHKSLVQLCSYEVMSKNVWRNVDDVISLVDINSFLRIKYDVKNLRQGLLFYKPEYVVFALDIHLRYLYLTKLETDLFSVISTLQGFVKNKFCPCATENLNHELLALKKGVSETILLARAKGESWEMSSCIQDELRVQFTKVINTIDNYLSKIQAQIVEELIATLLEGGEHEDISILEQAQENIRGTRNSLRVELNKLVHEKLRQSYQEFFRSKQQLIDLITGS